MGRFADEPASGLRLCSAAPDDGGWCARLNSDRTFKVGVQLMKAARYEDAARQFRRSLADDPDHFWAWSLLARVLAEHLDQPKAAKEAYRRAAGLDPAILHTQNAKTDPSKKAVSSTPEEIEHDRQAYLQALEIAPDDAEIWGRYGQFLQENLFEPRQALEAYERALATEPDDPWLWAQIGLLHHLDLEDPEAAETCYRKALRLDPGYAWAWAQLGEVLARQDGKRAEACASFRRALALDSEDAWAWSQLAGLLAEDRPLEAQAAYLQVARLRPGDSWPLERLNEITARLEEISSSEKSHLGAVILRPLDAGRRGLRRFSGWWSQRRKASP
jgi:Tfp pilus assembly protein PilF